MNQIKLENSWIILEIIRRKPKINQIKQINKKTKTKTKRKYSIKDIKIQL